MASGRGQCLVDGALQTTQSLCWPFVVHCWAGVYMSRRPYDLMSPTDCAVGCARTHWQQAQRTLCWDWYACCAIRTPAQGPAGQQLRCTDHTTTHTHTHTHWHIDVERARGRRRGHWCHWHLATGTVTQLEPHCRRPHAVNWPHIHSAHKRHPIAHLKTNLVPTPPPAAASSLHQMSTIKPTELEAPGPGPQVQMKEPQPGTIPPDSLRWLIEFDPFAPPHHRWKYLTLEQQRRMETIVRYSSPKGGPAPPGLRRVYIPGLPRGAASGPGGGRGGGGQSAAGESPGGG